MPAKKKKKWKPQKIKLPKVVKPAKAMRPTGSDLRPIYKGLITNDPGQMVVALAHAMRWYDKAMTYILQKAKVETREFIGLAAQARLKGNESDSNVEKVGLYIQALTNMQQAIGLAGVNVPDVNHYLTAQKVKSLELADIERRFTEKYSTMLIMLTNATKPLNVDGKEVKLKIGELKEPFLIDPEDSVIIFRRDTAREMYRTFRREGLLPLFTHASEPLARIAAMEVEYDKDKRRTGRRVVNKEKQWIALYRLWQNFNKWAATDEAPKRLVKRPKSPVELAPKERDPNKPKKAFGGKREYVAGHYVAGSAGAKLVALMQDNKWHEKTEMAEAVAPRDVDDRIASLKRRGAKYNIWTVEQDGSKYRTVPIKED